jgi:outer membrane protein TolC
MQMNPKRRSAVRLMLFVVGASLQLTLLGIASAQGNAAMELTLSQAIDLALKQNRSLKMAQLSVVDSEQKKKIARASYFPRINNQSTAFHVTELQQLVIPEGALGVGNPAKTAVIGQGTVTAYTSGTGLSQPFTQMFKIRQ